MAYNIELLYDRHDALYNSPQQLAAKARPLMDEFINKKYGNCNSLVSENMEEYQLMYSLILNRPVSETPDSERQEYMHKGLKLMALLNLTDILRNFRTTVDYTPELLKEAHSSVNNSWLLSLESRNSDYQYNGIRLMTLLGVIHPYST